LHCRNSKKLQCTIDGIPIGVEASVERNSVAIRVPPRDKDNSIVVERYRPGDGSAGSGAKRRRVASPESVAAKDSASALRFEPRSSHDDVIERACLDISEIQRILMDIKTNLRTLKVEMQTKGDE
jgi:hypothetical protein